MAKSVLAVCLLCLALLTSAMMASPAPLLAPDDQTSTTSTKKQADNPKKPTQARNTNATEKAKTDDRMSTRGLKPPPKEDDKASKDKAAKPDAKSDNAPK